MKTRAEILKALLQFCQSNQEAKKEANPESGETDILVKIENNEALQSFGRDFEHLMQLLKNPDDHDLTPKTLIYALDALIAPIEQSLCKKQHVSEIQKNFYNTMDQTFYAWLSNGVPEEDAPSISSSSSPARSQKKS
jgi:hypothetical protein